MTLLTSEYKKVYAKIAADVLEAAEHQYCALFEEMKSRDIMQDLKEDELDRVDEAIRHDFERNYQCAAEKDLHWQHLISGPLSELLNRMKKRL